MITFQGSTVTIWDQISLSVGLLHNLPTNLGLGQKFWLRTLPLLGNFETPLILLFSYRIDETLPTVFLEDDTILLEKNEDRDRVIGSLCEEYSVWSSVLEESVEERGTQIVNWFCFWFTIWQTQPKLQILRWQWCLGKWDGFKTDMYFYASENLMQVNVYIR